MNLLVECIDVSQIKFHNNGESSKSGGDIKLPPIYNERKHPYFLDNFEYNPTTEKPSRKGKEVIREYIDSETRKNDLTEGVLKEIDKKYGIQRDNYEDNKVKKSGKQVPRITRNYNNEKLSSLYLTDTGMRPLDTNGIFNYRDGTYGYNSFFSNNPEKLKEVLNHLGNGKKNIGFEISRISPKDYLSRCGSTAPILYKTVPINVRNLHILDLPEVKYHPYGSYAPNFDPKQNINMIELSKNRGIYEIDPFNIIS